MKRIEMTIALSKLNELRDALMDTDIEEMIVSEIRAYEPEKSSRPVCSRGGYGYQDIPKVKIELFASDDVADGLKEKLQNPASVSEIRDIISCSCLFHITKADEDAPEGIKAEDETDKVLFYWKVTCSSDSDIKTVAVSTRDAPDLLSKMAGIFTLNGFDILNAKKYSQNSIALNIFKVRPLFDRDIEDGGVNTGLDGVKQDLKSVLPGETDVFSKLREKILAYRSSNPLASGKKRPVIRMDNNRSDLASVIEVTTDDFPGLLFTLTDALFKCGLDVRMAKVSTKADQVEDVFFVKDFGGQKVTSSEQIQRIENTINNVLTSTSS